MRRRVSAPSARAVGPLVDRALPVGVHAGGTGVVLRHRARDRRDHHERDVGVAVPHLVEEAVDGGHEGALAHRVGVDDVDAELEADQVGGLLADHARRERVELALPGEGRSSGGRRRRAGRRPPATRPVGPLGFEAVRDRAAVVHPAPRAPLGSGGRTGAVGAELDAGARPPRCGSHTSTRFSPGGRPSKRIVVGAAALDVDRAGEPVDHDQRAGAGRLDRPPARRRRPGRTPPGCRARCRAARA